MNKESLR